MTTVKRFKPLSCAVLLGAALFTGALTAPAAYAAEPQMNAASTSTAALRTITVTGYGEVVVQPDIAYVQLGLHTTGKTAREAQEKNAKQFKAIHSALEKLNIPAADIQTVRLVTMPDYSWENNKQELKGYQVEQIVQVKYRNLAGISQLIDAATAAGANRIENVSFSSEKIEEYRMNAMDAALDNARLKAERMAKRAGVKIKETVQITDGIAPSPPVYLYNLPRTGSMSDAAKEESSGSRVYPGELKVGISVIVTYSY